MVGSPTNIWRLGNGHTNLFTTTVPAWRMHYRSHVQSPDWLAFLAE
jgi:hypothetical protein